MSEELQNFVVNGGFSGRRFHLRVSLRDAVKKIGLNPARCKVKIDERNLLTVWQPGKPSSLTYMPYAWSRVRDNRCPVVGSRNLKSRRVM